MRELYTSDGKKIEFTPEGHRVYEYECDVEDWENAKTTGEPGGVRTTTIPIVRKKMKYYIGDWIHVNEHKN